MSQTKMLIIGSDYPGIPSMQWEEINEDRLGTVTDYQVVIIDYEDFNVNSFSLDASKTFAIYILQLIITQNNVIAFLPRHNDLQKYSSALPFRIHTKRKRGESLTFLRNPIIEIYEPFLTKHEFVISNFEHPVNLYTESKNPLIVISNNIKEACGLSLNNSYFLHPPDKDKYMKSISAFVDYFSPERIQEVYEKPDWIEKYELNDLGCKDLNIELESIDSKISELKIEKENVEAEKLELTKWSELLFSQGKTLETILKDAFGFLGVKSAIPEPKGSHGPDLVVEHNGFAFTIEVEGTIGSIKVEKVRQLLHWVAEAPTDHKGVLIANPFREHDLSQRPPTNKSLFVKESVQLAQKSNLALITTDVIFKFVSQQVRSKNFDVVPFLQKLHDTNGIYNE